MYYNYNRILTIFVLPTATKRQQITKKIIMQQSSLRTLYNMQDKKYKIMSDIFRKKIEKYNKVSDGVSGLVNYRMMNQHH